jgi:hypothetical protein
LGVWGLSAEMPIMKWLKLAKKLNLVDYINRALNLMDFYVLFEFVFLGLIFLSV